MESLVIDLLLILLAGLLAGMVCKRLGISVLVGYLLVGGLIGGGGLGLVASGENRELQELAEIGALLLLFAIGIEFSLRELMRLSRYMLIGGALQMLLVVVPVTVLLMMGGKGWPSALLYGSAVALSSTVVVFKALHDYGQSASPHGRRAVGILLFQDAALVPLLLLVGVLTGEGESPTTWTWVLLVFKSAAFVLGVAALRWVIARWLVPLLAGLRSTELLILFVLAVVAGMGLLAHEIGLPPALGAFAAGLMLSGNRLTGQIDALVLPYREAFAAVFFVSLGTLMEFEPLLDAPLLMFGALIGVIALKTLAAALALRAVGLNWRAAAGMGLGLAQMGEFSFILLMSGTAPMVAGEPLVAGVNYARFLLLALGSLILTPYLIRMGLRWADPRLEEQMEGPGPESRFAPTDRALVVGMGPIGRQVASQLELRGLDSCLLDLSPVNLHPFAQQGFHTVAGDASDERVLRRADAQHARLVVITVPDDEAARRIVRAVVQLQRRHPRESPGSASSGEAEPRAAEPRVTEPDGADCIIAVRCRYQMNVAGLKRLGADVVVSEESEAGGALLRLLDSRMSDS